MKTLIKKLQEEKGGGVLVIFLFFLPLLVGVIGLGIDTARGVYTKQNIQNNAMSAIVGASSQRLPNVETIDIIKAKEVAINLYTTNRSNFQKMVECATTADLKSPTETLQGGTCKWVLVDFGSRLDAKSGKDEIYMRVREKTPTTFIGLFGVKEFTITTEKSARAALDLETS